ncbi:hypothetical protein HOLleu_20828 [Holothuria leucospilota]|uniref:Uncharacterized protein n=1 Tax=Holothuria leucospilota TaxID=206669 RepID=A0A9Q1BWM5_HOLLE|nr:hypothetical protein HOLleu_20828 [Holothuria leucospilota]
MRLQKLYDVIIPPDDNGEGEGAAPNVQKNADAFAELVQCLDDRSLSLVMQRMTAEGHYKS